MSSCSFALLVVIVACGVSAVAKERALVSGTLDATGTEVGASGKYRLKLQRSVSEFRVRGAGLAAGGRYSLAVGGVEQASVLADEDGEVRFRFRRKKNGGGNMDFDPSSANVEVLSGTGAVLEVGLVGDGVPVSAKLDERTVLGRVAASTGKARASFQQSDGGRRKFKVQLEGVAPGVYAVLVSGIERGAVLVGPLGKGGIEFTQGNDDGDDPALTFPVRGEQVDVLLGGVVQFSGKMAARAEGITVCSFSVRSQNLAAGAGVSGTARARDRTREDCSKDFEVELRGAADGTYDFLVDGQLRASVTVSGGEGEVEFDSDADDAGELPLGFDPEGRFLELRLGGATKFSGTFQPASGGTGGGNIDCSPVEISNSLTSTGADPDGSGDFRYRVREGCDRDLGIEIEDVPEGVYDVLLGGLLRGQINVTTTVDGVRGEVEFDTEADDPGEIPLDFEVRGLGIEIARGGTVYFTGSVSSSGTGSEPCVYRAVKLAMINAGVQAAATAEIRFRQDTDCDRDFKVTLRGASAGSYALVVGGVEVGTFHVASGEGEIEFDSDPDEAGELPLTFDPRGQLIEVRKEAATVFSRLLAN